MAFEYNYSHLLEACDHQQTLDEDPFTREAIESKKEKVCLSISGLFSFWSASFNSTLHSL